MSQEPTQTDQPTVEATQLRFETLLAPTGQAFVRIYLPGDGQLTLTADDTRALGLQLLDAASAADLDSGVVRVMREGGNDDQQIQAMLNAIGIARNFAYDNPFQGDDPIQKMKGAAG